MPIVGQQSRRPSVAWWLGLFATVAAGEVYALLPAGGLGQAVEPALAAIRTAGPWVYFAAMAVLPVPLIWFTVPAGEAFAPQLTLGGVIAAGAAAVAVQQALSYWIARYGLRPLVERLIRRHGRVVPRVTAENALSIALLVRLTPGPPMILGSCLLALAELPFKLYMVVSWLVALPWVCAGVVLGRGLLHGNLALVASGAGLLAVAVIATRLIRRREKPAKTA